MASQFFSALLSGNINGPQSLINAGGPLPSIPSSAPAQYHAIPDGKINPPEQSRLLQGGLQDFVYAYGPNPSRLTTQTQMNIPNKIQLIIPKIFIPSALSDGSAYQDPILEHAITDGDFVFSLKMNREMVGLGSQSYVIYPQGYTDRAVKLINLATANYILWGLQVGARHEQGGGRRWKNFFSHLCKSKVPSFVVDELDSTSSDTVIEMETVWNFVRSYLAPYGVQHGSDMQGGQHEGSKTRVVTNAVDYVSSFAVEGKILKMNNLWRAFDVNENDDLVLALRYMPPQQSNLQFVLSSSNRSTRNERAPVNRGWWYLNPEVLEYKTLVETPHIHVARSQKMISAFTQNSFGMDMPCWNARASIHGPPLQVTLEPSFVQSDSMWFRDTLCKCSRVIPPSHSAEQSDEKNISELNSAVADKDGNNNNNTNDNKKHVNDNLAILQHAYCTTGYNVNNKSNKKFFTDNSAADHDLLNPGEKPAASEEDASMKTTTASTPPSSSLFTKMILQGGASKMMMGRKRDASDDQDPNKAPKGNNHSDGSNKKKKSGTASAVVSPKNTT